MKILHVTQEMFKTSGVATFCREIAAEQARAGFCIICERRHNGGNGHNGA